MALKSTTTTDEFKAAVLDNSKLTMVDFWASWCGPCRAMAPTLAKVAEDMDAELDIVKVNVEDSADNGQLASEYGVQGIPNLQFFKNGEVVNTLVGMIPEPTLVEEIKKQLQ